MAEQAPLTTRFALGAGDRMPDHNYFSNLIWQIADLLRGPYRPPQYERVMLPLTVLRRFDCVLAPTKAAVVKRYDQVRDRYKGEALDRVLDKVAGQRFHNHSPLDFAKLKGDPDHVEKHLVSYIQGFSANVRRIFDYFELETEIEKMREANILYLVVSKFADVDLHPSSVPNEQMGLIFENLIRRFNELANETAGDHFTPREVIRLMVSILFIHDDKLLATPGTVRKLLDPACGTGGMLAEAQNYLREHHSAARLYVYGQDYNKRAFATAAADMLMKQVDHNGGGDNVRFGDSFIDDQFAGERFDYFLTNPPFGVDWKKQQKEIQREHEKRGFDGRFGAGLPRVNDGALLFLQHMIHKFEPVKPAEQKHGSRLAIVFSGSPLFTGGAGSGESEIRRWLVENDWLEAIVALPEQMFYNTGIGTYLWIVTNRKEKRRKGKIQLIDAREVWTAGGSADNKRSLGDKRRHMTAQQIEEIVRIYGRFEESTVSKIFRNAEFGYTRVTVDRPLRLRFQITPERSAAFLAEHPDLEEDLTAIEQGLGSTPHLDWNTVSARLGGILKKRRASWQAPAKKAFRARFCEPSPEAMAVKGPGPTGFEADPALRDSENVPLEEQVDEYFAHEVVQHVPDAWMDRTKDKIGYEISFTFHFHRCQPPRPLDAIYTDLTVTEERVLRLLRQRTAIAQALTRGVDQAAGLCDSGIAWLGKIPAHWRTQKAAWLFRERDERGEPELPLLEVSISQGVVPRELSEDRVESTAADFNTYKIARAGDVVFNKMRMWQGAVGVAPRDGLVSPDYVVAAPTGELSSDFAHLLFRTDMFSAECARRSHGIVWDRLRLYWEGFREIQLPVPPTDEQRAIVAHIADEAAKVDGLRDAAERSIALLRELIAAAVAGQIELGSEN